MAGFANDVVFGTNVDFTGTLPVSGQINLNGELLVGATVAPFIRAYVPTGSNGLVVNKGPGTLDFSLANIPNSALAYSQIKVIGGTGISVSGSPVTLGGTVTISNSAINVPWVAITADQVAAINTAYICNKGTVLTLTMPSVAPVGSVIGVMNINIAAGTKILSANPGQLYMGTSSATANTGSFTSINLGDSLLMVCTVANTTWYCYSVTGNWSVA